MSFKMLREAQAIAQLGEKADFIKTIQTIIGSPTITDIPVIGEEFDPSMFEITPAHYNEWLATVLEIAEEQGKDPSKRAVFVELANWILENDSLIDAQDSPDKTREKVIKALWSAYQVNRAHTAVQTHVQSGITKAREDEEAANSLVGSEESGVVSNIRAAMGVQDEETVRPKSVRFLATDVLKGGRSNPYPKGSLRAAMWDDVHNTASEDEERIGDIDDVEIDMPVGLPDVDTMSSDDLAAYITSDQPDHSTVSDELETRVDQLEDRIADLEHGDGDKPEELPIVPRNDENEERVTMSDLFRTAITSPREKMVAALKAVEDEGASAGASIQVPANPHPKKTPAHKAWSKGFKQSAKGQLGIVDTPRERVVSRKKR